MKFPDYLFISNKWKSSLFQNTGTGLSKPTEPKLSCKRQWSNLWNTGAVLYPQDIRLWWVAVVILQTCLKAKWLSLWDCFRDSLDDLPGSLENKPPGRDRYLWWWNQRDIKRNETRSIFCWVSHTAPNVNQLTIWQSYQCFYEIVLAV